jgi:hypothetical protein
VTRLKPLKGFHSSKIAAYASLFVKGFDIDDAGACLELYETELAESKKGLCTQQVIDLFTAYVTDRRHEIILANK